MYEGTRSARANDVASIEQLLRPLEENGILIHRSRQQVCLRVLSLNVVPRMSHVFKVGY